MITNTAEAVEVLEGLEQMAEELADTTPDPKLWVMTISLRACKQWASQIEEQRSKHDHQENKH